MQVRPVLPLLFFLFAATLFCSTPTAPPEPDRSQVIDEFLREKLDVWQKRLKLQNWNITLKTVRLSELKPKTLGGIRWDADTRSATIKVLNITDYKLSYPDALKDMEETIVHELVHLQLSSLPRNEASRSAEEKAVNVLSQTMLELDRSLREANAR